jgi:hypothetical protein
MSGAAGGVNTGFDGCVGTGDEKVPPSLGSVRDTGVMFGVVTGKDRLLGLLNKGVGGIFGKTNGVYPLK